MWVQVIPVSKSIYYSAGTVCLKVIEFGLTLFLIVQAGRSLTKCLGHRVDSPLWPMQRRVLMSLLPTLTVAAAFDYGDRIGIAIISSRAVWLVCVASIVLVLFVGLGWVLLAAVANGIVGRDWVLSCEETDYLGSVIDLMFRGISELRANRVVLIPPAEFCSLFKADPRRLGRISIRKTEALNLLGLTERTVKEIPHWARGVSGKDSILSPSAMRHNRKLYEFLCDPLWTASLDLCRNTPGLIATQWQRFHLQESVQLRFVTLMNTADLLQRYIAAIVLADLRDGEGMPAGLASEGRFLGQGSFRDWNKSLQMALAGSVDPTLDVWRRMLLTPRDDFRDLLDSLEALWNLLDYRIEPTEAHTLSAWRVLGHLRNSFIGHGTFGNQMKAAPQRFIGGLHAYFLGVVKDIVAMDLSLQLIPDDVAVWPNDRGFTGPARFGSGPSLIVTVDGRVTRLNPYFALGRDGVLVLHRIRDGLAEYVDFSAAEAGTPAFTSVEIPIAEFTGAVRPCS